MTQFNTQTCEAERSYRLQFETDNKEHYLFMQEAARICVDDREKWQLYTKMRGGEPVAYRYGPEWQATALMIDGGYKTPEEAKLAWLREWESQK